jgi:hypothetical protein
MTPEEGASTANDVDLGDVAKLRNRNEGIHQDVVTGRSGSARSKASSNTEKKPESTAQSARQQPDNDGSVCDFESVHTR